MLIDFVSTLVLWAAGLVAVASVAAGVKVGHEKGLPMWLWPIAGTFVVLRWALGKGAVAAISFAAPRVGLPGFRRRVSDPETTELIEREAVIPNRTPYVRDVGHGYHWTPAGVLEGVHLVVISQTGGAKGQTVLNYAIQYQLEYSDEHVILLEVKENRELTNIVAAYARPNDRVWIYTMQPGNARSSALSLTDLRTWRNLGHSLCHDPEAKDKHWNSKAAKLIPAAAVSISDLKGSDGEKITATLREVRDAIEDPNLLEMLREQYPNVGNIADVQKEWGYIRSSATDHLDPLSEERVWRVFDGGLDTPQPGFARYPDGGRDIVIIRPDEGSAQREARYVLATLDLVMNKAAQAGRNGGPGTKAYLDEFASFGDLSQMSRYLDLGRYGRVQISYVLQGMEQLAAAVGETKARAMVWSTEIKCVGATSDLDLARKISELAGDARVDFRQARQSGEILGGWGTESTPLLRPREITSQKPGEWTIVHNGEVYKRKVPREHFHHTQARKPTKGVGMRGVPKKN